nr:dehydrocurvularin biosynthesis regulator [Quercus suber]
MGRPRVDRWSSGEEAHRCGPTLQDPAAVCAAFMQLRSKELQHAQFLTSSEAGVDRDAMWQGFYSLMRNGKYQNESRLAKIKLMGPQVRKTSRTPGDTSAEGEAAFWQECDIHRLPELGHYSPPRLDPCSTCIDQAECLNQPSDCRKQLDAIAAVLCLASTYFNDGKIHRRNVSVPTISDEKVWPAGILLGTLQQLSQKVPNLKPQLRIRYSMRRKIRCVWPTTRTDDTGSIDKSCKYCLARERPCIPQHQQTKPFGKGQSSAHERINDLEQKVVSLASLVQDKPRLEASRSAYFDVTKDRNESIVNLEAEVAPPEPDDCNLPSHLRLLFDNFSSVHEVHAGRAGDREPNQAAEGIKRSARAKLQPLLPSHADIAQIATFASVWMDLYYDLFPAISAVCTGDQLSLNHERMCRFDAEPAELAMYLLSVAITAQQVPHEQLHPSFRDSREVTSFVDVAVRRVPPYESIEPGLLTAINTRSIGRGDLKGSWLTLRRIIAIAELIGLPQANDSIMRASQISSIGNGTDLAQEALQLKADLWEAICATDRNFGLMLNLPVGTARYRFPRDQSIWRNGSVSAQLYNYRLSNICALVFEIDEAYLSGTSDDASYEKVLNADRQLRALASSAARTWWGECEDAPLADLLVKFWHCYLMARVHLRPGMMNSFDEQYAYSRSACRTACESVVRRFPGFRLRVPSGFFVCQVLDVQVFTAATFLLLSGIETGQRTNASIDHDITNIVQQVIDCFDCVGGQAGSNLAREARTSLSSLLAMTQSRLPGHPTSLSLQIPLLGKIQITAPAVVDKSEPLTSNNENLGKSPVHTEPMTWLFEFNDQYFAEFL